MYVLKSKELKLSGIPTLGTGALDKLMNHHWPGNIRELANIIERALITNMGEPLDFSELQPAVSPVESAGSINGSEALDDVVSRHIQKVLVKTEGRINGDGGAAELLQIHPNTLRNRMDKLGIKYGKVA